MSGELPLPIQSSTGSEHSSPSADGSGMMMKARTQSYDDMILFKEGSGDTADNATTTNQR
jgi:hypothetical protein